MLRSREHLFIPHWFLCLVLLSSVTYAESMRIAETEAALTVLHGDAIVLVYNRQSPPVPKGIDPVYQRSGFLHPVKTPKGKIVTDTFPKDHAHQHGIFSAWVKTSYGSHSIDFWNLAGRTGRVEHERVVSTSQHEGSVGFEVDMLHRAEAPLSENILRERWKVTIYPLFDDAYCFDIESIQEAITDTPLVIEKYHYGGMALRGPSRWLIQTDKDKARDNDVIREPNAFANHLGQDRKTGNHVPTTWVALSGTIETQPASITVLGHPQNFRAPQPARLHDTKPYFCFSPCVTEAFEISRQKPLHAKYRYLVTDAPPNPNWIESQWQAFANQAF
jgi:Methane oxygenase PmoA